MAKGWAVRVTSTVESKVAMINPIAVTAFTLGAIALAVPAAEGLARTRHHARAVTPHQATSASLGPVDWDIGPTIRGRNFSQGVPDHVRGGSGGAMRIDLPEAPGSVHYVTFAHGSLAGKRRIVMRYRIETAPGVEIRPITAPNLPSIITLYFQRGGDDWSGQGSYETYRWYATFASQTPIVPGDHEIVASLAGNWTAIQTSSARTNPRGFAEAVAQADRVGFVLGGGDGYGHGVFATGPARLTVLDYRIE